VQTVLPPAARRLGGGGHVAHGHRDPWAVRRRACL